MIRFEKQPPVSELVTAWPYWYLATPYSKYPAGLGAAHKDASRAAAMLVHEHIRVFSPIAHTHPIAINGGLDPLDHEIWLAADEGFMLTAHGMIVVKMPTWDSSFGIAQETEVFSRFKKPILYMEWPQ